MCARTIQFQFGGNKTENIEKQVKTNWFCCWTTESNQIESISFIASIRSKLNEYSMFGAATPGEKISLLLILKEVKGLKIEVEISILHQEIPIDSSTIQYYRYPIFLFFFMIVFIIYGLPFGLPFPSFFTHFVDVAFSFMVNYSSQLDRFVCTALLQYFR